MFPRIRIAAISAASTAKIEGQKGGRGMLTLGSMDLSRVVLLLAATLLWVPRYNSDGALRVWTTSSLHRVGPDEGGSGSLDYHLWASRGSDHFRSSLVHLMICAWRVWTYNSILFGMEHALPGSVVELYRAPHRHASPASPDWKGPNRSLGSGMYPDGLIPFVSDTTAVASEAKLRANPFQVLPGRNQPIWVDVCVPHDVHVEANMARYTSSLAMPRR